ncbi:MgtC/SapB family protein [Patescibacteria group bacterium]|nr:MgtC/SapB family protein [Patescibacteria group bacterium]
MLTFTQMAIRLLIAMGLGGAIGLERESIGKEAGVRTSMLVCAGAAIFTMAGLSLPYIISLSPQNLTDVIARNSGYLTVIGNIVVGIGFLGAGLIIKNEEHVHGITTAAVVWLVAGVGMLTGLGIIDLAVFATVLVPTTLYAFRRFGIFEHGSAPDPTKK